MTIRSTPTPRVSSYVFRDVDFLTNSWTRTLNETSDRFPESLRTYDPREKLHNDAQLEDLLAALDRAPKSRTFTSKDPTRSSVRSRMRRLLISLELPMGDEIHDHEENFNELTDGFVQEARKLDPGISNRYIGQGLRNLWIFASLQVLFGKQAHLTSAGMAYSLLYPYTDNFVDDSTVTLSDKKEFVRRLRQKLEGSSVLPHSALEEHVYRFVDMIADEYPHITHPEVHESLLAIHHAQISSMDQSDGSSAELVPLTVRKGGTSVLADAYLAKGELTLEEFEFAFQYGVVLQLIDDFQDTEEDSGHRSRTLFTSARTPDEQERLMGKTFQLVHNLSKSHFFRDFNEGESFRQIIDTGCRMLLYEGMAMNPRRFSDSCVSSVERTCPVSFPVLARVKSEIDKQYR